jgi:hypothetical protein
VTGPAIAGEAACPAGESSTPAPGPRWPWGGDAWRFSRSKSGGSIAVTGGGPSSSRQYLSRGEDFNTAPDAVDPLPV